MPGEAPDAGPELARVEVAPDAQPARVVREGPEPGREIPLTGAGRSSVETRRWTSACGRRRSAATTPSGVCTGDRRFPRRVIHPQ
jgi:hypothetical protein